MALYASVILDNPSPEIDRIFDYEIPFELLNTVAAGCRVKVPFGPKNNLVGGYCLDIKNYSDVPAEKIKMVYSVTDKEPLISKKMIELAYWMKEKYFCTLSQCLNVILPAGANLKLKNLSKAVFLNIDKEKAEELIKKLEKSGKNLSQLKALKYVVENNGCNISDILINAKISRSPVDTLIKNGVLFIGEKLKEHQFDNIAIEDKTDKPNLNEEQKTAVNAVLKSDNEKPFLLFGITGSGKTEVYLSIIEEIIKTGKQAIVLVPEISLTPLIVGRFKKRFGNKAAVTHSKMSHGERYEIWSKAKNGDISIVIGPRSAVFMPFENLGIIIIDEEHESSYISETSPKYSACQVAQEICRANDAKLVLGSATPLIDSFLKAQKGEYRLLKLTKRAGEGTLPDTEIVDMRKELEEGNRTVFSRKLYYGIKEKLDKHEQIMLFLNRRGYSTFVSCRKCGHVMMCPNCSVSYRYHYKGNLLMCHYCGKKEEVPTVCPECGSKYIKYFGTGTQKIEDEVKRMFPSARVLRMDFDTVSKKGSHRTILNAFANGEADILIGTQMIAKGHDFPNVTLVGIMAADVSLNVGDYRGSEVTFELITQAAGRAGRSGAKGRVIIQTYQSEHYAIECAARQDYESFYKKECAVRKTMEYPPFSFVYTLLFSSKDENKVNEKITDFSRIITENKYFFENKGIKINIIGPTEAVVYKVKNEYRMTLSVKCPDEAALREFIKKSMVEYNEKYKSSAVNVNLYMSARNMF